MEYLFSEEGIEIIKKYKYFAVLHDFDCTPQYVKPYTVEASHVWSVAENILGRMDYIRQIEEIFEKEKRLGMLVAPNPIHAHYLGEYGDGWDEDYGDIEKLAECLGIQKFIEEDRQPADWSTCFWCRSILIRGELEKK